MTPKVVIHGPDMLFIGPRRFEYDLRCPLLVDIVNYSSCTLSRSLSLSRSLPSTKGPQIAYERSFRWKLAHFRYLCQVITSHYLLL